MLKTAVIGTGVMGQNHARVLAEVSHLSGVVDVNETAGKNVAKRFNVPYFKDYKDIPKDVEAVIIATPTVTHKNIALDIIASGRHVLVEKPLAESVQSAQAIVDAAHKQGITFAVGHIERHNPAVKYAKAAAQNGQFGKVISAHAKRVSSYPGRIGDVGVVIDLAIHDIDIIRYVTGLEVESVFASGGIMSTGKHEDTANILLQLKGGVTGLLEVNWLTPMRIRRLTLTCSSRYVEVDYMNQTVDVSSSQLMDIDQSNLSQIPQEYDHRHITLKKQEPLKNELLDFISAVEKKHTPLVSGEDGAAAVRIADAALESIRTKKVVDLA
jgi:UDP-N-acetylglucosamine 3-dehydrogenase